MASMGVRYVDACLVAAMFAMWYVNACSTVNVFHGDRRVAYYVDSAIEPHLTTFKVEAANRGLEIDTANLSMLFGDPKTILDRDDNSNAVGACNTESEPSIIVLDKEYWDKASPADREALVFHELGHCLLGRSHCTLEGQGLGLSLMEPTTLPKGEYEKYREALVDELFNPFKECM